MATQRHYTPAVLTGEPIRKSLAPHGLKAEGMIGPPCLLTYPDIDLEGDWVNPDGGRWVPKPFVNLDHMHPIGWAKSLPVMKSLKVGGEVYNVPIGQTKFFASEADMIGADLNIRDAKGDPTGKTYKPAECLHLAKQVHKLVNAGLMNGTSLEFKSLHANPIGKSALRGRTAWEHTDWVGLGWAHTAQPVNPGAQSILDDLEGRLCKSLDGEPHPLIRKSFGLNPPKRTSVVGGYVPAKETPMFAKKAIPEDDADTAEDYAADDDLGEGDSVPSPGEEGPDEGMEDDMGGEKPTPTVAAFYQGAQSIADVCSMIDAAMQASEHMKGKKFAMGICDKLKKIAGEVQGMGDKIAKELKGGEPDGDEMEDGEEPAEDMDEDAEPDMDEEGSIIPKSFPGYRAKRIKASDFGPPIKKAQRKDADKFVEVPKDQWELILAKLEELPD